MKRSSIFLVFFMCCGLLFAEVFHFSGNRVQTVFAKGKEHTLLSGNARVISDDNNITADSIELYGKDNTYVICNGNVRLINTKKGMELTCEKMFYDRKLKKSRVQGNAVMVDRENQLVVKGGFIEDNEEQDITIIEIGVRILKEDMACRSEFARYFRKEKKLELSGMPIVNWKGDEYRASKIYIDLDKDEITLEGEVSGELSEEEKAAPEQGTKEQAAPEQGAKEQGAKEQAVPEQGTKEQGEKTGEQQEPANPTGTTQGENQ
jgi:lipopolysaccharide export system protein LptA